MSRPKLELRSKEDITILKKGVSLLMKKRYTMKTEMRLINLYQKLQDNSL